MKICDYIVHYLKRHAGLTHLFTYAGGTNAMLMNSAARIGGIKIVPMRHEENAALAADGYAKIKHSYGFALSMSGPGATNMITGIAQSFFDSTPVLYLTGNVTTSTYKYDLPFRQLGYQETDIVSIVRPITKNAYLADQPGQLPQKLRFALRECLFNRPGPALLDVPFDTQKIEIDENELNIPVSDSTTHYSMTKADFDSFMSLLTEAKRPVILAGAGIQISNVAGPFSQFARLLQIPVVHTLPGKDAFPNNDELYRGFIGSYGNRHANQVLFNADLVIALGCRLSNRQTAKTADFSRNKRVIHVDIDPMIIGHNVHPDLGIAMDLKDFFNNFVDFFSSSRSDYKCPDAWSQKTAKIKSLLEYYDEKGNTTLNPKAFLRDLSRAQSDPTVYAVDVGGHQMWSAQSCMVKAEDRMIYSAGLGTMGYAIPASIGAHFASPESNVFAICGDGGFQMSLPELQTIVEFKIPVKIVVINNCMLGLMKNFQDENFDGLHIATVIGYSVPNITGIAGAFGIPAKQITGNAETGDAISWLSSQDGPAILEVRVDQSWGPYPKVLPGSALTRQHPPLTAELENDIKELLS